MKTILDILKKAGPSRRFSNFRGELRSPQSSLAKR